LISLLLFLFLLTAPATTYIYPLSLHDTLPIFTDRLPACTGAQSGLARAVVRRTRPRSRPTRQSDHGATALATATRRGRMGDHRGEPGAVGCRPRLRRQPDHGRECRDLPGDATVDRRRTRPRTGARDSRVGRCGTHGRIDGRNPG